MSHGSLLVAGVVLLFGVTFLFDLRGTYRRYVNAETLVATHAADDERIVVGPVDVDEPARPERLPAERLPSERLSSEGLPSDLEGEAARPPAVWAWRIREQVSRGSKRGGTRWRTVEGGLAVGAVSVADGWEDVRIERESAMNAEIGPLRGATDPFDAPGLHLGGPEIDVPLGEPDPITRRLERWGILGDDGLLDAGLSVGIGRTTLTPDRYQATVVREGEELFVAGEREAGERKRGGRKAAGDRPSLRASPTEPMILARGDLERKRDRLRRAVRRKAAVAAVAFAVAVSFGISTAI